VNLLQVGPLTVSARPARGGRGRRYMPAHAVVSCAGSMMVMHFDSVSAAKSYVGAAQCIALAFSQLGR
jgi:hypothetical protein